MYYDRTVLPEIPGRLAQFMRLVDAFEREEIETAVELLIERMDAGDGDPDLEDDERSGVMMRSTGADIDFEDDPIAEDGLVGDPIDAEEDDPGEPSDEQDIGWTEWHGRASEQQRAPHEQAGHPGAPDDSEADGDELDGEESEDDFVDHPETIAAGCPIADDDSDEAQHDLRPVADREAFRWHLDRIRDTRCVSTLHGDGGLRWRTWRLKEEGRVIYPRAHA